MDDYSPTGASPEPLPLAATTQETQEPEAKVPVYKRTLSRRRFLVVSVITGASGAGLLIAFSIASRNGTGGNGGKRPSATFTPSVWVRIDSDDRVTITVAKSEMGQGVLTALAMAEVVSETVRKVK